MAKSKELCRDCREDYYNHAGRDGCWSYAKAKVVKRVLVGTWQPPPYIWRPRAVLSCYHREGEHLLERDDCRVVANSKEADKWRARIN